MARRSDDGHSWAATTVAAAMKQTDPFREAWKVPVAPSPERPERVRPQRPASAGRRLEPEKEPEAGLRRREGPEGFLGGALGDFSECLHSHILAFMGFHHPHLARLKALLDRQVAALGQGLLGAMAAKAALLGFRTFSQTQGLMRKLGEYRSMLLECREQLKFAQATCRAEAAMRRGASLEATTERQRRTVLFLQVQALLSGGLRSSAETKQLLRRCVEAWCSRCAARAFKERTATVFARRSCHALSSTCLHLCMAAWRSATTGPARRLCEANAAAASQTAATATTMCERAWAAVDGLCHINDATTAAMALQLCFSAWHKQALAAAIAHEAGIATEAVQTRLLRAHAALMHLCGRPTASKPFEAWLRLVTVVRSSRNAAVADAAQKAQLSAETAARRRLQVMERWPRETLLHVSLLRWAAEAVRTVERRQARGLRHKGRSKLQLLVLCRESGLLQRCLVLWSCQARVASGAPGWLRAVPRVSVAVATDPSPDPTMLLRQQGDLERRLWHEQMQRHSAEQQLQQAELKLNEVLQQRLQLSFARPMAPVPQPEQELHFQVEVQPIWDPREPSVYHNSGQTGEDCTTRLNLAAKASESEQGYMELLEYHRRRAKEVRGRCVRFE